MAINLIDIALEHFTEGSLKLIGEKIGLPAEDTMKAVGKAFPALLSVIGKKAETEEGAGVLFDIVKNADQSILGDLAGAFTGDTSSISEAGGNALSALFAGNSSSIIEKIGSFSGLASDKAGGLLGLLTPILTGIIGKQVSTGGLGIGGLQSLMKDQESFTTETLGNGFLEKLGIGGLLTGAGATLSGLGSGAADAVSGIGTKVTGLATSAGDKVTDAADAVGDKITEVAGAAGDKVAGVAGAAGDKVSGVVGAAGEKVSGAVGAAGEKVTDVVGAAGDKVVGVAGAAGDKVSGAVGSVGGAISGAGSKAASTVGNAASTASSTGGGFLKFLPLILLPILAFFLLRGCMGGKGIGDSLKDAGDAAVDGVKSASEAVGDGAKAVGEGAMDLSGAAVDGVKSAGEAVGEGAKDLGGAAVDGVKSAGTAIGDGAKAVGDAAVSGAEAVGEGAKNLGGAAVDGVKSAGTAIGDGAKAVGGAAVDGAEAIGEGAKAAGEAVKDGAEDAGFMKLSDNVKNFTDKLTTLDASDDAALDEVYTKLSADGSSKFLYRIPFQTGETGVPAPHQEALIAKLKTASPDATLVTIGYADVRGDDALNKRLSYGRAQEVGSWIKNTLGGDTSIETFSMGETDRFSKSDYSKNRVVEVWQVAK